MENGTELTIIDCEGKDRASYFHLGEGLGSVLHGFAIIGGHPHSVSSAGVLGVAIYCNSSPIVEDNIIRGNMIDSDGSGI